MKKAAFFLIGFLILLPCFGYSQPSKLFQTIGPSIDPSDLRVLKIEMAPDPAREGQLLRFYVTISNLSYFSGWASIFIKDRDEVIAAAYDVLLRPAYNRIAFPETNYRLWRYEHCFTVEVDIERTRRPVDLVKEFCSRRSVYGWTLSSIVIGPFLVEDLEMFPDPVQPGQEVRFRLRLRNEGPSIHANIRIQDRDQIVAQLTNVILHRGSAEYHFPYTRYPFQRFDHCFTLFVDVERTPYRADSIREFCARPLGWTLRP